MENNRQSMKWMMVAVALGLMPWIDIQAVAKPLKVFILAGESNIQEHANVRR